MNDNPVNFLNMIQDHLESIKKELNTDVELIFKNLSEESTLTKNDIHSILVNSMNKGLDFYKKSLGK